MKDNPNDTQIGGNHYKNSRYQVWDFIDKHNIPYLEGNVIKYLVRAGRKDGAPFEQDVEKARHYLYKITKVRGEMFYGVPCADLQNFLDANPICSPLRCVITLMLDSEYTLARKYLARGKCVD